MYTARQIDAGLSPAGRLAGPRAGPRRVAHILAAVVALTMATASAAGLLIDGIYQLNVTLNGTASDNGTASATVQTAWGTWSSFAYELIHQTGT